jgi:hypothetical protein
MDGFGDVNQDDKKLITQPRRPERFQRTSIGRTENLTEPDTKSSSLSCQKVTIRSTELVEAKRVQGPTSGLRSNFRVSITFATADHGPQNRRIGKLYPCRH